MRTGALALFVLMLVAALAYLQGKSADSSSYSVSEPATHSTAQAPPALNGAPLFWFPSREEFVTRENDPFLVLVGVNCGGSQSAPRFELLPPTPEFVSISLTCPPSADSFARTLVAVTPGSGHAGKYQVKIGATGCGAPQGEVAREILSFRVRVKRAQ